MRLRRLVSVGVVVAVTGFILFPSSPLHAQQNAGFGGTAAQGVPAPAGSPGLSEGPVAADAASPQWYDGSITSQWGVNCVILGGAYEEIMLQSMVGYWGTSDVTYPRVGERYWGRVFLSVPGNACADGVTDAFVWIRLPPDTQFAITPEYPVRCFYSSASTGGSFVDITNDPAAACPHTPSGPDSNGWYYLNCERDPEECEAVADPNWRIEAAADYNGDGKLDLVWRNYSTGAVNAWFLNGTTYTSGAGLFTVADPNWEIAGPR